MQAENLKGELQGWLKGQDFPYFVTVTYRTPRNPQQFFVEAQRVEHTLSPGTHGFLVGEEHKTGFLHLHALVGVEGGNQDRLAQRWTTGTLWLPLFRRFGRTLVVPAREIGGAVGYCTKYIAKDLTDHWWLW